jgi:hypothetical protein
MDDKCSEFRQITSNALINPRSISTVNVVDDNGLFGVIFQRGMSQISIESIVDGEGHMSAVRRG